MSSYTGFVVDLTTAKGVEFKCSYKSFAEASEAMSNLARRPGYFIMTVCPGDAPPEPTTMAEWVAAGNTTD